MRMRPAAPARRRKRLRWLRRRIGLRRRLRRCVRGGIMTVRWQRLRPCGPAVDAFFDKVMVMAPEAEVRAARLGLLARVLRDFSQIADFSEIVVAG